MVGDNMLADVSGALEVGMRAVWKRNDRPWPKPEGVKPSATIERLAELPAVLRSWGAS
jgi:putative hydrolase of the HAD superfamily